MNEAILNKLVELGYTKHKYYTEADLYLDDAHDFTIIFEALIAECAKHELILAIKNNELSIFDIMKNDCGEDREYIVYEAPYSHQAIIEAFCKVTGVECDT